MALVHEIVRARVFARLGSTFLLFGAALLVAGTAGMPLAFAQKTPESPVAADPTPEPRPEILLRGEVVETACFVIGNRRGETHRQCAIASARAGQDLGILDEKTGQLHVAIVDRRADTAQSPLVAFIAHRVEVRGEPLEYGELPSLIVHDVRSLGPPG